MPDLQIYLQFLSRHVLGAVGAMVAFFIGVYSARFVLASNIRPLMAVPVWLLRKLGRFLRRNPTIPALGLLIFAFNGTAMLVYLLLGLIPFLPAVVAFFTGMNVAIGAAKGPEIMTELSPDKVEEETPEALPRLNPLAAACSVAVLLLELPCFWFTIAMASGMTYNITNVAEPRHLPEFKLCLMTYVSIILPLLAVSAFAESYSVLRALKPPKDGGPKTED